MKQGSAVWKYDGDMRAAARGATDADELVARKQAKNAEIKALFS